MTSQLPDGPGDLRERPLGELLKQLSEETTRLVHQELELAKAELIQKGRQAGIGAGLFGAAGAVGLLAAAALTTCFILLLDMAMRGRTRVKQAVPPVPEQTIETVKEDVQWAKNQTRSAKR